MFLTYQQIRKDEGFFFFFFSLSFFSVVEKAVGLQFTPASVQAWAENVQTGGSECVVSNERFC